MLYDNQKIIECPKCGTEREDFEPDIYLAHTKLSCSKCGFKGYNFSEEDRNEKWKQVKEGKEVWKRIRVRKCKGCDGSGTVLNNKGYERSLCERWRFVECSKCKGDGYNEL